MKNETRRDVPHTVTKAFLSGVPVAGGPLVELFAYIVTEPASKRRDEWIETIASRLQELEDRRGRPIMDQLKNDECFITVLMNASKIAVQNHQKEKIKALTNAVVNVASGQLQDDTQQAIFLGLVDRLTLSHLAVLAVLRDPNENAFALQLRGSISTTLIHQLAALNFPELSVELLDFICLDLRNNGLLKPGDASMYSDGRVDKLTTEFGNGFLEFISDPKEC